MSEVAIIDGNERLPQLAWKINEAHASVEAQLNQVEQHKGYALEQAVAVGDALNEAKASLSHGQFQPWLDENCPNVKRTQVTDYMGLARAVADGQLQITRAGNLSIRDAVKQLSAPRKALQGVNVDSRPQRQLPQPRGSQAAARLLSTVLAFDAEHANDDTWESAVDELSSAYRERLGSDDAVVEACHMTVQILSAWLEQP